MAAIVVERRRRQPTSRSIWHLGCVPNSTRRRRGLEMSTIDMSRDWRVQQRSARIPRLVLGQPRAGFVDVGQPVDRRIGQQSATWDSNTRRDVQQRTSAEGHLDQRCAADVGAPQPGEAKRDAGSPIVIRAQRWRAKLGRMESVGRYSCVCRSQWLAGEERFAPLPREPRRCISPAASFSLDWRRWIAWPSLRHTT